MPRPCPTASSSISFGWKMAIEGRAPQGQGKLSRLKRERFRMQLQSHWTASFSRYWKLVEAEAGAANLLPARLVESKTPTNRNPGKPEYPGQESWAGGLGYAGYCETGESPLGSSKYTPTRTWDRPLVHLLLRSFYGGMSKSNSCFEKAQRKLCNFSSELMKITRKSYVGTRPSPLV